MCVCTLGSMLFSFVVNFVVNCVFIFIFLLIGFVFICRGCNERAQPVLQSAQVLRQPSAQGL